MPKGSDAPMCFTACILRKQADLPRYIVVPAEHIPGRQAEFAARVTLNGVARLSAISVLGAKD
ncbi:MAG: hypothetical protein AAFY35_07345 [Pseudomonadota bacterium]